MSLFSIPTEPAHEGRGGLHRFDGSRELAVWTDEVTPPVRLPKVHDPAIQGVMIGRACFVKPGHRRRPRRPSGYPAARGVPDPVERAVSGIAGQAAMCKRLPELTAVDLQDPTGLPFAKRSFADSRVRSAQHARRSCSIPGPSCQARPPEAEGRPATMCKPPPGLVSRPPAGHQSPPSSRSISAITCPLLCGSCWCRI